jgi:hypothetical protein
MVIKYDMSTKLEFGIERAKPVRSQLPVELELDTNTTPQRLLSTLS